MLKSLHCVVDEHRPAEERFRVLDVPEFPDRHLENPFSVFPEPELGAGEHRSRGRSFPGGVEELFGHGAAVAAVIVAVDSRHLGRVSVSAGFKAKSNSPQKMGRRKLINLELIVFRVVVV